MKSSYGYHLIPLKSLQQPCVNSELFFATLQQNQITPTIDWQPVTKLRPNHTGKKSPEKTQISILSLHSNVRDFEESAAQTDNGFILNYVWVRTRICISKGHCS